MFSEFLLGLVLVTSLIMIVLLVQPRPGEDMRTSRLPFIAAILVLLLAALALATGVVAGG